jgi:hypothetical protein
VFADGKLRGRERTCKSISAKAPRKPLMPCIKNKLRLVAHGRILKVKLI